MSEGLVLEQKNRTEKWLLEEGPKHGVYGLCALAAWYLIKGDGESNKLAVEKYTAAAEAGCGRAMYYLGYLNQNGFAGLTKNEQTALSWYTKAAEKGDIPSTQIKAQIEKLANAAAANTLAQQEAQTKLEAQQDPQLEKTLREALAAIDVSSWSNAVNSLNRAVDRNFTPVVILLREVWAAAPCALGKPAEVFPHPEASLRRTIELTPASQRARGWKMIEKILSGDRVPPSAYLLAAVWKDLVEESQVDRVRFLRMASDFNVARAHYQLSLCLQFGNGCEVDLQEAARLRQEAEKMNDAQAVLALAKQQKSIPLLEKSLQNGHLEAKALLMQQSSAHRGATLSSTEEKLIEKVVSYSGRNFAREAECDKALKEAVNFTDAKDYKAAKIAVQRAIKCEPFGVAHCLERQIYLMAPNLFDGADITYLTQSNCSCADKMQRERGNQFVDALVTLKPNSPTSLLVAALWYYWSTFSDNKPAAKNPYQLMRRCAETYNHPRALTCTAMFLLNQYHVKPPIGVEADLAVDMLKQAIAMDDVRAKYYYGTILGGVMCTPTIPKDFPEAVKLYRAAANQKDCMAMYELGMCLKNAIGTEQNWDESREWLQRSLDSGYRRAESDLAVVVELLRNRSQEQALRKALAILDQTPGKNWEQALAIVEESLAVFKNYLPLVLLRREIHLALPKLINEASPISNEQISRYNEWIATAYSDTYEFVPRAWTFLSEGLENAKSSAFTMLLHALWNRDVSTQLDKKPTTGETPKSFDKEYCESVKCLRESIKLGCGRAATQLAQWLMFEYLPCTDIKLNQEEAFQLLEVGVQQDDAMAHLLIGDALSHAIGIPTEDLARAKKEYELARANGFITDTDQRLLRLSVEVLAREALYLFDNSQYQKAKETCKKAQALCTVPHSTCFYPVDLLIEELRLSQPAIFVTEPEDPNKTLMVKKWEHSPEEKWAQIFIDEVLIDARTKSSVGLVISGLWLYYRLSSAADCKEIKLYERAAKLTPPSSRGYHRLGMAHLLGRANFSSLGKSDGKFGYDCLKKSAELGDTDAQWRVGQILLGQTEFAKIPLSIPANVKEGMQSLRMSVAQKYKEAQLTLGHCCFNGVPGAQEIDFVEAATMFRLSAVQNHPEAQYWLAICLRDAKGVPENWDEALHWFQTCVEMGYATLGKPALELHIEEMRNREQERRFTLCMNAFAEHKYQDALREAHSSMELFKGFAIGHIMLIQISYIIPAIFGLEQESLTLRNTLDGVVDALISYHRERSKQYLEREAKNSKLTGVAEMMLGLWMTFVEKDEKTAITHYKKSIAGPAPLARAQTLLGECYAIGSGIEANQNEAASLYKLAAAQNDATALYHVSQISGLSDSEVLSNLRASADLGYNLAQYKLGVAFKKAQLGLAASPVEAMKLFVLSGDQGNAHAAYKAGFGFSNGIGVPGNHHTAVKYFTIAHLCGHAKASHALGRNYETGCGCIQDWDFALGLYRIAVGAGVEGARESLAHLQSAIQEREVAEAQIRAAEIQAESARAQQDAAKAQKNAAEASKRLTDRISSRW